MQRGESPGARDDLIFRWLIPLLFVLIQIQTTIPLGSVGVRMTLADLVLPLVLITTIVHARPRAWGLLNPRRLEWLLLMFTTLWFAVAIAHGRAEIGHWQSWALLNRGGGWLVLLAFFYCGWILGFFASQFEERSVMMFLAFFWLSCLASATLMVLLSFRWPGFLPVPEAQASPLQQTIGLIGGGSRFQGFLVNPNSFGFLAVSAIAIHLPYVHAGGLLPRCAHVLGLGLSLFGLFWSFSRGAWAAVIVVIAFLVLLGRLDWRALGVAFIVAVGLSIVLWFACALTPLPSEQGLATFGRTVAGSVESATHRLVLAEKALSLWWGSPLTGSGVGTFLESQASTLESPRSTIHSTYLWLLAETGIIGLASFGAFFIWSFTVLLKRRSEPPSSEFTVGAAAVLVALAVITLVMEAIYQRHLWLILGVALGFRRQQAPLRRGPSLDVAT